MRLCAYLLLFLVVRLNFVHCESFYDILGVSKSATIQQIKKAYRAKAKESHPDKNGDPATNEKFMKITEAYEVLTDPKKRQEYDVFGHVTSDGEHRGSANPFSQSFHFSRESGHEFFRHSPFGDFFNQQHFDESSDRVEVFRHINYREYKLFVEPQSHKQVQIILGASQMCFHCVRVRHLISQMLHSLYKNVGGMDSPIAPRAYHFLLERDGALRDELHVHYAPSIMLVLSGRVTYYTASYMTKEDFIEFFQNAFPSQLVAQLGREENNLPAQTYDWSDNKVRILYAKPNGRPSLRFLLTAFRHRDRVRALYVNTEQGWRKRLKDISLQEEALWLFREGETDPGPPQHGHRLLQASFLSGLDMEKAFAEHKHLYVPRIESQAYWNELCPPQKLSGTTTTCVTLLTDNPYSDSKDLQSHLALYRTWVKEYASHHLPSDWPWFSVNGGKVVFTYINANTQRQFLRELNLSNDKLSSCVFLLTIRLQSEDQVYFKCYSPDQQQPQSSFQSSLLQMPFWLKGELSTFHAQKEAWKHVFLRSVLVDETVEPLWLRIWYRIQQWCNRLWLFMTDIYSEIPASPLLLILMWIGSILFVGFGWRSKDPSTTSQEAPRTPASTSNGSSPNHAPFTGVPPLLLSALTPVSYDSLIRCAPQGQLTIILCLSNVQGDEVCERMKKEFLYTLQRYRNIGNMKPTFLAVQKWSRWLCDVFLLATHPIGDNSQTSGNPLTLERMHGLVLAVNGFRQWFSILYPLKYTEGEEDNEENSDLCSSLGLNGDAEEQQPRARRPEKQLVLRLQPWVEKLLEGTLYRHKLERWPLNMRTTS